VKPPFTYFGGKMSIAGQIVTLLPAHDHYVEPFAGSLAVLLAKPPSRAETVNDLDGDLMNFWQVLRDRPADLERACLLTPHSRIEYQQACQPLDDMADLERARRVWVRLTQGRHRTAIPWAGWRHRVNGLDNAFPAELSNTARRITPAAARLASVTLESLPALEIIAKYGKHPGTLIYADPPYPSGVRGIRPRYAAEMHGDDSHRELLKALSGCCGPVVLSGYACPLYDDALSSWHRREIATQTGNGTGDLSRTEVLWSNRPFPGQGSLFDEAV
jgi:DNA adenine methylase